MNSRLSFILAFVKMVKLNFSIFWVGPSLSKVGLCLDEKQNEYLTRRDKRCLVNSQIVSAYILWSVCVSAEVCECVCLCSSGCILSVCPCVFVCVWVKDSRTYFNSYFLTPFLTSYICKLGCQFSHLVSPLTKNSDLGHVVAWQEKFLDPVVAWYEYKWQNIIFQSAHLPIFFEFGALLLQAWRIQMRAKRTIERQSCK